MSDREPGSGRYAHLEREQRWLASGVPDGATLVALIIDRYILGTRLRLRRTEGNGEVVFKLGQKVRVDLSDPERVMLTNIYLSPEEYEVFAALSAAELHKTRWRLEIDGRHFAIDEFEGHLAGLVLVETELSATEALLSAPAFATKDVTADDRYSGGALATATDEIVDDLLR